MADMSANERREQERQRRLEELRRRDEQRKLDMKRRQEERQRQRLEQQRQREEQQRQRKMQEKWRDVERASERLAADMKRVLERLMQAVKALELDDEAKARVVEELEKGLVYDGKNRLLQRAAKDPVVRKYYDAINQKVMARLR